MFAPFSCNTDDKRMQKNIEKSCFSMFLITNEQTADPQQYGYQCCMSVA